MKVEAIYKLEDVQRLHRYIKENGSKRDLLLYSLGINTISFPCINLPPRNGNHR